MVGESCTVCPGGGCGGLKNPCRTLLDTRIKLLSNLSGEMRFNVRHVTKEAKRSAQAEVARQVNLPCGGRASLVTVVRKFHSVIVPVAQGLYI